MPTVNSLAINRDSFTAAKKTNSAAAKKTNSTAAKKTQNRQPQNSTDLFARKPIQPPNSTARENSIKTVGNRQQSPAFIWKNEAQVYSANSQTREGDFKTRAAIPFTSKNCIFPFTSKTVFLAFQIVILSKTGKMSTFDTDVIVGQSCTLFLKKYTKVSLYQDRKSQYATYLRRGSKKRGSLSPKKSYTNFIKINFLPCLSLETSNSKHPCINW